MAQPLLLYGLPHGMMEPTITKSARVNTKNSEKRTSKGPCENAASAVARGDQACESR